MSTSCGGLKNSGCSNGNDSFPPPEIDGSENNPLEPRPLQRVALVDGNTGLWTLRNGNYGRIQCPVGGTVVFYYPLNTHDVVQVETEEDFKSCNFSSAVTLSPRIPTGTISDTVTYFYNCSTPNTTHYLTCSVPGHCAAGQKVIIETTNDFAWNASTGEWNFHVTSLRLLLTILGYRQEASTGLFIMDRGFQTEDVATHTANLIWCALDHCPSAAHDVDPTATNETCASMIYTLLGYVHRKRPLPQWTTSLDYYQRAIKLEGPNQCAAESYLTQLYLNFLVLSPQEQDNHSLLDRLPNGIANRTAFDLAYQQTRQLCTLCSATSPLLVQQARAEYRRLEIAPTTFAFDDACNHGGSRASSSGGYSVITLLLWMLYACHHR